MIWATIKGKIQLWLALGGAVLVAIAVVMIRKSGGDAERAKQAQADLHAANTIAAERAAATGLSEDALNKEVDRWSRKP